MKPRYSEMEAITIDKQHYCFCSLVSTEHIANSLGEPIELPPAIADVLENDYAEDLGEPNLLQLFSLMKGCEYELAVRDNTYNHETDLDQFFIYSVYAPVGKPDWLWQRDCFVVIEMGTPGDPRYSSYGHPAVYHLSDDTIGDSGFLNWQLSWQAQPISKTDSWDNLDNFNERLSQGYSGDPTFELGQLVVCEPIWNEKRQGYLAKFKDHSYPVLLTPYSYIQ
jgi:hypothetical protein